MALLQPPTVNATTFTPTPGPVFACLPAYLPMSTTSLLRSVLPVRVPLPSRPPGGGAMRVGGCNCTVHARTKIQNNKQRTRQGVEEPPRMRAACCWCFVNIVYAAPGRLGILPVYGELGRGWAECMITARAAAGLLLAGGLNGSPTFWGGCRG